MKKTCFNYMMIAFISLCTSAYGWAQKTINLNEEGVRIQTLSTTQNVPADYLKTAKMARSFTINKALQSTQGVSVGDVITLDLFEGKSYDAKVSKITTDVNGTLAITAKLLRYPLGSVIITTAANRKSLVTVNIPELKEEYVSRGSISSPQSYLIQVDKTKEDIKRGGNDAILPPPSSTSADKGAGARKLKTFDTGGGVNDPANIDIMVVYTPAAELACNSSDNGIANAIASAVAVANLCADNSQVIATFTLVHSERVDYTEVNDALDTDLSRLQNPNDGYMDNVQLLRNQYGADLVCLFEQVRASAALGRGYLGGDESTGFSAIIASEGSANTRGITMAHEMGHNIGMDHNIEDGGVPNAYAPYAYGWHWGGADNRAYGSVMSYIGQETNYYSNPNVSYAGAPTGKADEADNARLFRERKHIVAAYREPCTAPPAAPSGLGTGINCNSAILSWAAAANDTSFLLEYKPSSSSEWITAASNLIGATYTLYLADNTTYNWRLTAQNNCGNSTVVNGLDFTTGAGTQQLDAPTGLSASNITGCGTTLSWSAVSGAASYKVEYKASDTDWTTATSTLTAPSTLTTITYPLSDLTAGTTYNWRVTAQNNCGNSTANSDFTTAPPLAAPTGLSADIICNGGGVMVTLNWSAVSGASYYTVEYKLPSASTWTTANNIYDTTYTLYNPYGNDLTPNTTYNWRVTAQNNCGSSTAAMSDFTTATGELATPTGLSVSNPTCSGATLSWNAVSGATSYLIEYKPSSSSEWTGGGSTTVGYTPEPTTYTAGTGGASYLLTPNTIYNWRVTAQNDCGTSTTANGTDFTTGSTTQQLDAPTMVPMTGRINCNGGTLVWNSVRGATYYLVEGKASSDSEWKGQITTGTLFPYGILFNNVLKPNTTYNWRVTALNDTNCETSATVNGIDLTTAAETPLDAPTDLSVSISCNNWASMSWTPVSGATSYLVEYKLSSASEWTSVYSTSSSFSLTDDVNTTYNWRVTALNTSNCGSSITVDGSDFTIINTYQPEAPTGLTISDLSCGGATLSWSAVSEAASYTVEYKTASASEWTTAATIAGDYYTPAPTTYTLNGLTSGAVYNWRITANDACGNATTTGPDFTTLMPAAPTGLTVVSDLGCNGVILSWAAASGVTNYKLEYKTSSASEWTTASSTLTTTSYTLSGLTAGATYNWRVTAQNACGNSTAANGTDFTVLASLPAEPKDLTVSNLDCSSVTLNWTAVNGAATYKLEYKTSSASEWTTVASTLTATSYTLNGLTANTAYNWRVTAQNDCGSSAAITGFTTLVSLPAAPTGLTASAIDCSSVSLRWTAASGAATYKVEYKLSSASTWTTATSTVTGTTYTLSGLASSTTYNWRVTAQNSCGSSAAVEGTAVTVPSDCESLTDFIHFEDPNFKALLLSASPFNGIAKDAVGNSIAIDANGDGEISYGEALNVYQLLSLNYPTPYVGDIKSMGEIQYFTNLTNLTCRYFTSLQSLDLSKNINLTTVDLFSTGYYSTLSTLDITKNINLQYLELSFTGIGENLDVSHNINLQSLSLNGAKIKTLNLSNNVNLRDLNLQDNTDLQTLDVSSNINLQNLYLYGCTGLTSLYMKNGVSKTFNPTTSGNGYDFLNTNLKSICCDEDEIATVKDYMQNLAANDLLPAGWQFSDLIVSSDCESWGMGTPTGLTVSDLGCNSVTLSWTAASGAASYKLEYKPSSASEWTTASSALTATTYTLNGLTTGTTYNWRVTAQNDYGNSTTDGTAFTTLILPAAPTGLSTSNLNCSGATLSWTEVNGATSYKVEYKTTLASEWTTATSTLTATTYTLSSLTVGMTYNWRVTAQNDCGSSTAANGADFTALASSPTSPTDLTTSDFVCNSVTLSWTAASGAATYKVEYKTTSASDWTTATSTLTDATYTLSSLTAGTTYNWRVTAQNSCGSSTAANGTDFTALASAPTEPTGLSTSNLNCSGATLSWTEVSGAATYKVEYKTSSASGWATATSTLTAANYTLSSLTAETTYNWRVTAQNDCGSSTVATGSNFTTLILPTSPTGLTVSDFDCSGVTLSWTAVSGATSYKVEYKTSSASDWATATSTLTTATYTLSGLTVGTTYNWRVTAQNSCGSSTTVTGSNFTTLSLPAAPTGLSASNLDCSGATLSWTAVSGATSYKVEYKIPSASEWTTAASTLTATTYTLSGLAVGTTYNWRVTAQNSCGSSTVVTSSSFTTLSLPATPTSLSVSSITCNSAALKWNAATGATSYKVEYKASSASEWTTAASTLTATSYTLSSLADGTAYNWRVTAQNSCGSSTAVTGSNFTTLSLPATPTGLSTSNLSCSGVTLSWTTVSGATSYKVEYKTSSASDWTTATSTLTAATYALSSLTAGTTYNWRVTAQNTCGSSTAVTGSNFTTLSLPTAPTGLTASDLDCSGATLSWTAASGAATYKVEYKTSSASEWTTAASTLTSTTYTLNSLTAGTTYNWRVTAQNTCGSSTAVTGSNFTTLSLPAAPTGLSASNLDCSGATLSWTAVSGATSYKVEYKIPSASEWTTAASTLTATTYTLSGLAVGTTYNWRVTAQNSCGSSTVVTSSSFTTLSLPVTPTSLSVSSITCNSAALKWNAATGATSYKVEYKASSASEWTTAASTLTATSYTLSSLADGIAYNWRVTAQNSCGSPTTVTGSNFTTLSLPTAPTGLTSSNLSCSSVTLSWTAVSGAATYKVEYKTSSASDWTTAASTLTATSYTLNGLTAGTTYNWRVTAQNSCGSSTAVTGSNFTTLSLPTAPTGLTVSNLDCSGATLSWTAVSGATSYKVEYKTSSASIWTMATSSLTTTSYTLSGLTNNTTYNWRVTAQNSCGSSTAVTSSSFTTLSLPATPTSLSVSSITCNSAALKWNAATGAASYKVEYKTSSASEWTTAASTLTATSYTLSSLADGTAYNWRVTAQNSCGSSTAVTGSNFTTLSLPATPTGLSTSNLSCSGVTLSWTTVSGATSYKVEYKTSSASEWTTATSTLTATTYTLNGLTAGTTYNWRVTAQNSCGNSTAVTGSNFTTLTLPTAPTDLTASDLDCHGATLSWTAVSGATSYKVEYKTSSASIWTMATSTLTATSYTLSGLTNNTTYNWRITAQSSCGNSAAVMGFNFATTANCLGVIDETPDNSEAGFKVQIYPNPNSGVFKIKLSKISDGTVQIIDFAGSLILTKTFKGKEEIEINIHDHPTGAYLVKVHTSKGTVTKKIIKGN